MMNAKKNLCSLFLGVIILTSIRTTYAAADKIYTTNSIVPVFEMTPQWTGSVSPLRNEFHTIEVDKNGFPLEKNMVQITDILEWPYLWYLSMSNAQEHSQREKIMFDIKSNINEYFTALYKDLHRYHTYKKNNPEKIRLLKQIIQAYSKIVKTLNTLFYMRHSLYDCSVVINGTIVDIPKEMNEKAAGKEFQCALRLYYTFSNAMAQFFIKENRIDNKELVTKISSDYFFDNTCLGFCKHGDEFYPFVNNTQKVLSERFIGDDILLLMNKGEPIKSNGFLMSPHRAFAHDPSGVSNIFDIDYIEGALSSYPFRTQKIMSVPFDINKKQLTQVADIVDDTDGILMGFFALPTTSYEVQVSTIAFIEYLEEEVKKDFITKEPLMLLYQHCESIMNGMLQSLDTACVEKDSFKTPLAPVYDDTVKEKVLNTLAHAKETYKKTIIQSEYDKAIEAEQQARSRAVAQGATQSRKSNNKGKKKMQSKKAQQQPFGKEKVPVIDKQKIEEEVQEILEKNVSGSRVKVRHLIKILNAINKKYAMDTVNVRINGSHYNFDASEGQTPSFGLPHGKKDSLPVSVANVFLNQLVQAVALLNLKGQ